MAGFAVLGASAVTNTGPTVVTGDLGIAPSAASSVTGFPPGTINGTTHFNDAVAVQAQTDATTVYNSLAGQACNATISADLGGSTLTPGVYCAASSMGLTGALTLNAQGDPNAVFIFQIGSTLTTASNSSVLLTNGGNRCNIFWQVGSSATLGTGTSFLGNIFALASITLTTGASGSGRLVARTGAVTLDSSLVSLCTLAPATLVTQASPAVTLGGSVSDTATLSGGVAPTGSITFSLFGPNNAACTGVAVFTSTVPVTGNASYLSASFVPAGAGTYRWIANYSGDANNAPTANACNAANENVVVAAMGTVIPTLVTQASASVPVGGSISDSATLSGGTNPTGTITFNLYGLNDPTCTATPVFTATVNVAGNGVYPSGSFVAPVAGTYRWIANYSGDAGNAATANGCNAANESVIVTRLSTTLLTQASPPVSLGNGIADTGILSAGPAPTGTITFNVYGPDNATCSGIAAFTSTAVVNANGAYASAQFVPTAPGTYRWVANYGGDANNAPTVNVCNAPNESVVVAANVARIAIPTLSGFMLTVLGALLLLCAVPGIRRARM